jgi:hypothetical protein
MDDKGAEAPSKMEVILKEGLKVEEAEEKGGLALLNSPYVNPGSEIDKDLEWYREAFPGAGRTMVTWGALPSSSSSLPVFAMSTDSPSVHN